MKVSRVADPLDIAATAPADEHAAPWSRVLFSPPEAWVEEESYDASLAAKEGSHLTQLLWVRQVQAGAGLSFHSTATRLETSLAVQHQSQWSVEFDPRTQRMTLHWLRVVRDGHRIDHLDRKRMRLIQRETQLERLVIDGRWTLVSILEDVRPGDVIEAAYTCEAANPIRPDSCEVFFAVPPQLAVGRYRLGVLFDPSRTTLAWKASADAPERREDILPDGRRRWTWEGAQQSLREPEINQPSSFLDYLWVQVSNLVEWNDIIPRVAEAWNAAADETGLDEIPAFVRPATVDEDAITRLIQHIQDEFRYLSFDLEAGGWIPAAPGKVARRRYGDCKDFAWLATVVLRRWGVAARPILVGTGLRERVATLVPMTLLFNHAVVEVEFGGKTRWFDLTERAQGGDYSGRAVGWFGHGLPIDATAGGLRSQPGAPSHGSYSLRETILLDTRLGETSMVEYRVRAEGWQADRLRQTRLARGVEEFAVEREQHARQRYGKAGRTGALHWRDDRVKNVCEVAEAFEIKDAVYLDERGNRALFDVPASLMSQSLALPQDKPRRSPWAMPFPLELHHEVTVKAGGMGSGKTRHRRWEDTEFNAFLEEPRLKGAWTKKVRFTVLTPEVPPERVEIYRRQLEQFLKETTWRLYLPPGHSRNRRGDSFGRFSKPAEISVATPVASPKPPDNPVREPTVPTVVGNLKVDPAEPRLQKKRTASRRFWSVENVPKLIVRLMVLGFLMILLNAARGCYLSDYGNY